MPYSAWVVFLLCSVLAAVACSAPAPSSTVVARSSSTPRSHGPLNVMRFSVEGEVPSGISGIDRIENGDMVAVAERDQRLVFLHVADDRAKLVSTLSLEGFSEGQDAESLAWMGKGHFAVGTERHVPSRAYDEIFFYQLENDHAGVPSKAVRTDVLRLSYGLWGIQAEENRGIEGACFAGSTLLVGVETTLESQGQRYAPLARYDIHAKVWTGFRLRLTSQQGLLSSLACRLNSTHKNLEVLAIERFYETSRLLTFHVPIQGTGRDILPVMVQDLAALTPEKVPNWEGIAWGDDGTYLLLNDNQTGESRVSVEVMRIKALDR